MRRELLEFTNRQLKITRIYAAHLWKPLLIGSFLFCAVFFGGLALADHSRNSQARLTELLLALLFIFTCWAPRRLYSPESCGDSACGVIEKQLSKTLPAHLLLWPLASSLFLMNAVVAACSRRIKWRGITYELKSANEAVIIARESVRDSNFSLSTCRGRTCLRTVSTRQTVTVCIQKLDAKQSRTTRSTPSLDAAREASRHRDPVRHFALQRVLQDLFLSRRAESAGRLTFAQIEKISRTMPPITDLWLSGGEPTLRRDVSEIINLFVENNGVDRVIIPTNGLIKSRVFEIVDKALGSHPKLDLYLNIALDGYGETHDQIRGVPGNWEKALDCIRFALSAQSEICGSVSTQR